MSDADAGGRSSNLHYDEYRNEARDLKQLVAGLQEQLRKADQQGNRRRALEILGEMFRLQDAFNRKWSAVLGRGGR